jgi:hypothetical protein
MRVRGLVDRYADRRRVFFDASFEIASAGSCRYSLPRYCEAWPVRLHARALEVTVVGRSRHG